MNTSKTAFIAFFAIVTMNIQFFAADIQRQPFIHTAKIGIAALLIAATTTLATPQIDIDLDEVSTGNLLTQSKSDNVKRGYWPEEASVRLERVWVKKGPNNQLQFCCRATASYNGFVDVEIQPDEIVRFPERLGKSTEGCFSEQELETFGVILPKQFRDLRSFNELNTTGNINK